MTYTLYNLDCLQLMRTMDAGSVDAIITDPPYYKIMGDDWDNQWETLEDYISWIDVLAVEWRRILKPNGSLYIFADDKVCAYIQVCLDKHFLLVNNIVWYKTNNMPVKYAKNLRSWANMTERILFYTAQYDATGWGTVKLDVNNFQPLREYFYNLLVYMGETNKGISTKLGHRKAEHAFYVMPKKSVIEKVGQQADHCFRYGSTQWDLPTEETYQEIIKVFSIDKWGGFREYDDLRREYDDLRREYDDLRRVFNADDKTFDIITGPIVSASDNTAHPTTKPVWLMDRIVRVSTNRNMTVFDPFAGSGTTGVACMMTGRNFIGCELDAGYYAIAEKRIHDASQQLLLPIDI